MNKPVIGGVRKFSWDWSNKLVMGIPLCRYGASWLHCGGKWNDHKGFMLWMMNIPFKNEAGEIVYISQDDSADAYEMMSCGKFELQETVKKFLSQWDAANHDPDLME